ncbi:PREDICTED: 60 kDa lysophospholipase isoform X2 [Cercocebus atys]|uniref:60 kDa lysophospholipase isoform X2 n=1 Tax=Cercocebus atys TaxID=9531 RepID=UPI0005F49681|nr:PREDICTED: 60 kDa lysophospholipase isoform X2 [Cercocebus atys]
MARAVGSERRLLAVYTGGTIGMRSELGVLVPGTGLAAILRTLPMFHDEQHARACGLSEDILVLPPATPNQRILYTVLECQPLFDSSDMTIAEWVRVAQTIERHYKQYHGFVVIHGTDTMAFAASMLSFMLENLQKTVILTGAQVSIHALWSDGRENLLGALLMAGQYVIPEVCLFFQNQLFRGNRTTKVDARRFAAFCSPNLPPLATVGADVTVNRELVRKVGGKAGLVVHSSMEQDVGLLRLYPGIPAALVRAFLQPPLKGMVMETFGSGNGPTKPDLLQELQMATKRGLVIVNCTHCLQGTVTTDYAAGMAMEGAGVISGFDMTSEAALAKLSYVLGQPGLSLDDRKEPAWRPEVPLTVARKSSPASHFSWRLLTKDLRGEMTPPSVEECQPSLQGNTLGRGVSWLLSLSGSQEADALRNALMPSLACAAAHAGNLEVLQVLVELGSDLGLVDFNGQTPLHAAARGGQAEAVTMLLQGGVDVNTRDTDGFSPLLLAVRGRHSGVIGLLREAGASLSTQELEEAGTELCRLAYRADLEGLQVWWQAGADLGQPGYDGHSALHVAEAAGNLAVVAFLQSLEGAVGAQVPCPEVLPGV